MNDYSTLWTFKTVTDKDRSYISNEGYEDDLKTKYVYDNSVANYKQVQLNDLVLIVDKVRILGYGKISKITKKNTTKTRRRCPVCRSTNYEKRKTLTPTYRCNKKHEFDAPLEELDDIIQYEAYYGESFTELDNELLLPSLRPFYVNNYNRNMSIQRIDHNFLVEFDIIKGGYKTTNRSSENDYYSGNIHEPIVPYEPYENADKERAKSNRMVSLRKGQAGFKDTLIKRYGLRCMITGCTVKEVIEAAHILPYKSEDDNHVENGLLLRSDIHALFDSGLIWIDGESLVISINDKLKGTEYMIFHKSKLKLTGQIRPSKIALRKLV